MCVREVADRRVSASFVRFDDGDGDGDDDGDGDGDDDGGWWNGDDGDDGGDVPESSW